jgi:tetratricopeptide (TPR) repeat protein
MRLFNSLRITGFICLLLATHYVCSQSSTFKQELQAGSNAVEPEDREKAIEHLKRAVALSPGSVQSHLALARAYRAEYRDEMDTDNEEDVKANDRMLEGAIDEFKAVVVLDPSNTEALNNLGNLHLGMARYDEAGFYFRQSLKVNPSDKEALYSLAFVNWLHSYQFRIERRSDLGLRRRAALIRNSSCSGVRSKNLERIEEGIAALKKLSRVSDFLEVPFMLSMLYRERADIQCGDRAAYDADLRSVKEWEQAACAARARKAEFTPYPWPPAPAPPQHPSCLWK